MIKVETLDTFEILYEGHSDISNISFVWFGTQRD